MLRNKLREEETREVEARLIDALIEMGSWEDVWMELYSRGVTGVPLHGSSCPVAKWLQSRVLEDIGVTSSFVFYAPDTDYGVSVSTPENVSEFIRDFDNNKHPEMIEGNN